MINQQRRTIMKYSRTREKSEATIFDMEGTSEALLEQIKELSRSTNVVKGDYFDGLVEQTRLKIEELAYIIFNQAGDARD